MPPDLAPAAAPVVPAEQPPAPAAKKSFDERFGAMEAKMGATGDDEESEQPPAPAPAAPEAPKKAALDPKEAKLAQLKAMAVELGLVFDGSSVSTQEAIEVRAAKRRNLEWKAQREAEFAKKEAEFSQTHGEKLKKSAAVLDAYERGDPEAFAAALGAKDFNELQQSWIKRLADPNYMELRRLQQRAEQEDARREAEKKETETRAQTEHRQQVYAGYMRTLSETCKMSSNPLVQSMAEDPLFLRDVYRIQEENWDDDTQRTVTVEEAIKKATKGNAVSLEDSLKQIYERLGKGFASVGQTAPPAAAKTNGKKPAPKTAVVPSTAAGGASAAKKPSEMTTQEWRKHFAARMNETED